MPSNHEICGICLQIKKYMAQCLQIMKYAAYAFQSRKCGAMPSNTLTSVSVCLLSCVIVLLKVTQSVNSFVDRLLSRNLD